MSMRSLSVVAVLLVVAAAVVRTDVAAADPPPSLAVVEVTATSSDGNIPENTIDGDLTTRWSAQTVDPEDPEHITWDLGEVEQLGYLGIAWHQGDLREAFYAIAVSTDGQTWQTVVADGASSGSAIDLEPVTFDGVAPEDGLAARYVRYLGFGNSAGSGWNSITAFRPYPPHDDAHVEELAGQEPQPDPDAEPFTAPGRTEPDGSPRPLPTPNRVTGETLDVTTFGADPADGDHDDTPAILAAIEAATPGDEVYLPDGVYNLASALPSDRSSHLALRSGINLRGESREGPILRSSFSAADGAGKVIRGYGVSDVVISDLTVTSTYDGPFSDDHRDDEAGGGPQYGIFLADAASRPSARIYVDSVIVERFERMGVRIANSQDVVVQHSLFRDATSVGGGGAGYGVSIQGVPKQDRLGFPNDSRHNVVRDSTFEGPHLRHGVLLQFWTHNNLVADNTLTDIVLDAVDLHGEDEYLNEVRGNRFERIRAAAVGVGNTGGTPPTNHDASGPGNWIHRNKISGSREGVKIHLGSPDTVVERNTISGAGSPAAAKGIYLLNAPGTVVRDNAVTAFDGDDAWGIHLALDPGDPGADNVGAGAPSDIVLTGNRVMHNRGGVLITAGEAISLSDNLLRNNGEDLRIDVAAPPPPSGDPPPGGTLQLPTDDTMIDNGSPDRNFGDADLLKWKRYASGSIQRVVYYRYEIDDPAAVDTASLELSAKLTASNPSGSSYTFEVHGLTDDGWTEDTLTWDNAPARTVDPDTWLGDFTMTGPLEEVGRFRVDVTDFVRQQTDGVATFVVIDTLGQGANVDSYSKERGTESLRPGLRITR
jgi:hypothetical protein